MEQINVLVKPEVKRWLDEQSVTQGVSVGRIIEELVASFIEQEKEG